MRSNLFQAGNPRNGQQGHQKEEAQKKSKEKDTHEPLTVLQGRLPTGPKGQKTHKDPNHPPRRTPNGAFKVKFEKANLITRGSLTILW